MNLQQAMKNPNVAFASPEVLESSAEFTPAQKRAILLQWKDQLEKLLIADREEPRAGRVSARRRGHRFFIAFRTCVADGRAVLPAPAAPPAACRRYAVRHAGGRLPAHAERFREVRARELEEFMASLFLPEEDRRRLVPLIEPGPATQIVRDYVRVRGADLVVLGTQGRGAVAEAFIGSTAKSILATLPCDALVTRGPPR